MRLCKGELLTRCGKGNGFLKATYPLKSRYLDMSGVGPKTCEKLHEQLQSEGYSKTAITEGVELCEAINEQQKCASKLMSYTIFRWDNNLNVEADFKYHTKKNAYDPASCTSAAAQFALEKIKRKHHINLPPREEHPTRAAVVKPKPEPVKSAPPAQIEAEKMPEPSSLKARLKLDSLKLQLGKGVEDDFVLSSNETGLKQYKFRILYNLQQVEKVWQLDYKIHSVQNPEVQSSGSIRFVDEKAWELYRMELTWTDAKREKLAEIKLTLPE